MKVISEEDFGNYKVVVYEKKVIPTLEEVQKLYPIGTRIKSNGIIYDTVEELFEDNVAFWSRGIKIGDDSPRSIDVYSKVHNTKAEIIEPLFTNSHGTKFYMGDEYTRVKINSLEFTYGVVTGTEERTVPADLRYIECKETFRTEILTKEQAEQYVLDNRVFENGEHYRAVLSGRNTCARWVQDEGYFYVNIDAYQRYKEDFDSIGDKIEF
jgi:hypothetical protein